MAVAPPSFVAIDLADLEQLYVSEHLTMSAVAARLGCSATTVRRRLLRFRIPARSRGPDSERLHSRQGRELAWRTWSPAIAYVVGLIATDGNLSSDGRHLSIPSKDLDLLESLRMCLGLTNSICRHSTAAIAFIGCSGVIDSFTTGS